MDIGSSGPIAGFLVSVVAILVGLHYSEVRVIPLQSGEMIVLGDSLLFIALTKIVIGSIPDTYGVYLHPVAFAGWIGLFVTSLNLIPAGQLDGGHVLRAMIGEKAKDVSRIIPFILISLGFYVTYFLNRDGFLWVLWGIFLSFFTASGHPRPLNDDIPLDKGRMALGIITFILGLLCFTLVPFQMQ